MSSEEPQTMSSNTDNVDPAVNTAIQPSQSSDDEPPSDDEVPMEHTENITTGMEHNPSNPTSTEANPTNPTNLANMENGNPMSSSLHSLHSLHSNPPRLQAHPEDSVAYITVSDPVTHTEGIKGKFTMYRVAYDPPVPSADKDPSSPSTPSSLAQTQLTQLTQTPLFSYATSVNRRYSDFSLLYDHLQKSRPGAIVPPLPEKHSTLTGISRTSHFSQEFVEERRFYLELFLRRVVTNPELRGDEFLLVFVGGGEEEWRRAKKEMKKGGSGSGGSGGGGRARSNSGDEKMDDYRNDRMDEGETNDDPNALNPTSPTSAATSAANSLMTTSTELLSTKKSTVKKWLREKKTTMQGNTVRMPDDAIFERVTLYVNALEAGLKRVEAQAGQMVRREGEVGGCWLEFGLGCDALGRVDEEVDGALLEATGGDNTNNNSNSNSNTNSNSSSKRGASQTFVQIGKTSDALSTLTQTHHQHLLSTFLSPLRDHLKMVHAVKIALHKRNNRRITLSTCIHAVDSKKTSLHKYRITPGMEHKVHGTNGSNGMEASLSRAEMEVERARVNYEEVSQRVLREVDRFRRENAVVMHGMMVEFARVEKEFHERMCGVWEKVVPELEGVDFRELCGVGGGSGGNGGGVGSFYEAARVVNEGAVRAVGGGAVNGHTSPANNGVGGNIQGVSGVSGATAQFQQMAMPSYPPPPEPTNNGGYHANGLESSTIRYRELPEE